MGNSVFPMLPGLAWNVGRAPIYSTQVQQSVSGAQLRAEFFTAPMRKWTLAYEFLRDGQGFTEVDAIQAFFQSRNGKFDSFLFQDPTDKTVTDMGFGAGDGTTAAFQLQRAIVGTFVRDGLLGTAQVLPTLPRTNMQINSADITSWFTTQAGTGVAPVKTPNYSVAPDGTLTADRLILDIGAGTTNGDSSLMISPVTATVIGQQYVLSVWMRNNAGDGNKLVTINNNSSTAALITVTQNWQRFQLPFIANLNNNSIRTILIGNGGTSKYVDLSVWGWQVELGSVAGDYIPTTTVPVTVKPAYWPASADGFEPIYNVDNSVVNPSIYMRDWTNLATLMSPFPRTNYCFQSQTFNTSWSASFGGTGIAAAITADFAVAPDGTTTADRIVLNRGAGVTSGDFSLLLSANGTLVIGRTYTASVWLRGNTAASTFRLQIQNVAGVVQDLTLTLSWQRYSLTFVANNATTHHLSFLCQGNQAGESAPDFLAWGGQIEDGSVIGWYIPTTTVTVTQTDYTLSSAGLVTFNTAPRANAPLSWTGNYFWRVHFVMDIGEYNQFMTQLYDMKKIELETSR